MLEEEISGIYEKTQRSIVEFDDILNGRMGYLILITPVQKQLICI